MQILYPGDDGFEEFGTPWNLTIPQQPASVALPESAADVAGALRLARDGGLPVGVQTTGHGAVRGCDGGVLINLSRLNGVTIDGDRATARVGGGSRWGDVLRAAEPYGLAGLSGTSAGVGVTGYTLGGGIGLLLRRFGFAADSVLSAEVVTAAGDVVRVSADERPDLFWALKGAGFNFGIVTELELQLYPVPEVYNGMLVYPIERAADVLGRWAEWTRQVPDSVTAAAMVVRVPPIPRFPEQLHGKQVVLARATVADNDPTSIDRLRSTLGEPLMDTFGSTSYLQAVLSGLDPQAPTPSVGRGALLAELSGPAVELVLEAVTPDSPLPGLEIRHLGGAAAQAPARPSAISHRDAPYVLHLLGGAATPEDIAIVAGFQTRAVEKLKPYLHPGRMINFLSSDTSDEALQATYGPAMYNELRQVKRTYDPDNVFQYNRNIPPSDRG